MVRTDWEVGAHQFEIGQHQMPYVSQKEKQCNVCHPDIALLIYYIRYVAYLLRARLTLTAQATVQPTIGLLPIPRKPIIST